MNFESAIFYLLAAWILTCAVLTVTSRGIFRSAIFLLATLAGIGGLYFYMEYPFIAAAHIIVYVGGIVVLILFAVFLTQQAGTKLEVPHRGLLAAALAGTAAALGLSCYAIFSQSISKTVPGIEARMKEIGHSLLSPGGFMLPFEVVGILLLASLVGCIAIAMKTKTP